uniref:CCHC-type domain-containing protein n=1 Tax=Anopheles maculatus TaxID=74869 RepID=A0A182SHA7_9DIPT
MGRRTGVGNLRVPISRSVDSAALNAQIQQVLGEMGTSRVVTELGDILISNVDPLATEQDIRASITAKLEVEAGIVLVSLWEMQDGTQRARVRLPLSHARKLDNQKLRLCGCISFARALPKLPQEKQRCFRCLVIGHLARDCKSPVDRQNLCIRCGVAGHLARGCTAEVQCIGP